MERPFNVMNNFAKVVNSNIKDVSFFDVIVFALVCVAMLVRMHFAIDFTDESWYVAEPFLVANGAIPYVNNWSQTPGFTVPLAFFYKMFCGINGGTEGIFLFSRLLYLGWISSISLLMFILVRRYLFSEMPLLAFAMFPLLNINSLYAINYNSIGVVYLALVLCLLCPVFLKKTTTALYPLVSGIVIARAIIGTPVVILPWVAISVVLFTINKRALVYYLIGNCAMAIFVIGGCVLLSDTQSFYNGLSTCVNDLYYFKLSSDESFRDKILSIGKFFIPSLIVFCLIFIAKIKTEVFFEKWGYRILAVGIVCGLFLAADDIGIKKIAHFTWFIPFVLKYIGGHTNERMREINLACFVTLCAASSYVFAACVDIHDGFLHRTYWFLFPAIINLYLLYKCGVEKGIYKLIQYKTVIAGYIVLLIFINYANVYRDKGIYDLDTEVASGLWKGIYTTSERADAVVGIEKVLNSSTSENDDVLVLDWASYGYMMAHGNACAPTALDSMCFLYRLNNPDVMFKYYMFEGKVPSKIVYIDKGGGELMSIEVDGWKFNDFVNAGYILKEDVENIGFRVRVYALTDSVKAWKEVKRKV